MVNNVSMTHVTQSVPILTERGIVERGTAVARTVGFPTANIPYDQADISGTYAGRVLIAGIEYQAAVYANLERKVLEAHVFDFSGDLYGTEITVMLLEKIAVSEQFRDSKDEKTFIEWVVSEVKDYFNKTS